MAWTLRVRGAGGGTIPHEYLCPEHGRFTADVPRDDVPDQMPCPVRGFCGECAGNGYPHVRSALFDPVHFVPCVCGGSGLSIDKAQYCGLTSPWSPSSIATKISIIGFSRGKAEVPPTPHALTTRDLADGMPMGEWRAKRAKLREERRRKRIKEIR